MNARAAELIRRMRFSSEIGSAGSSRNTLYARCPRTGKRSAYFKNAEQPASRLPRQVRYPRDRLGADDVGCRSPGRRVAIAGSWFRAVEGGVIERIHPRGIAREGGKRERLE